MVERSYNGWPATTPSGNKIPTRVIEPVNGVHLRIVNNPNVAAVFTYLVQQFHNRVNDLTKPHPADDWGYAYRANVNNPSQLSNHASGTALDLDATEHPNGVPTTRTFSKAQIDETHKILKELDGVVRWGGDYTHTPDAMHFEINVAPGGLHKIASKIRRLGPGERLSSSSSSPTPGESPSGGSPAWPLKDGSEGQAVRKLQEGLNRVFPRYAALAMNKKAGYAQNKLAADGFYGPHTELWVKEFQRRSKLKVDGIVGDKTADELEKNGVKIR